MTAGMIRAGLLAGAAALVLPAPVASADTAYDQQFVNTLQAGGWSVGCSGLFSCPFGSPVALAHNVCDMIHPHILTPWQLGMTPRQAANGDFWWVVPPGSPKAYFFVKTAITFYCPQYLPQVDW